MKKLIAIFLIIALFGCARSKTFNIDGKDIKVEPYGWMDDESFKNDSVVYRISTGNVVWSIIGFETIVAPIILTGKYLYEPVIKKDQIKKEELKNHTDGK